MRFPKNRFDVNYFMASETFILITYIEQQQTPHFVAEPGAFSSTQGGRESRNPGSGARGTTRSPWSKAIPVASDKAASSLEGSSPSFEDSCEDPSEERKRRGLFSPRLCAAHWAGPDPADRQR